MFERILVAIGILGLLGVAVYGHYNYKSKYIPKKTDCESRGGVLVKSESGLVCVQPLK